MDYQGNLISEYLTYQEWLKNPIKAIICRDYTNDAPTIYEVTGDFSKKRRVYKVHNGILLYDIEDEAQLDKLCNRLDTSIEGKLVFHDGWSSGGVLTSRSGYENFVVSSLDELEDMGYTYNGKFWSYKGYMRGYITQLHPREQDKTISDLVINWHHYAFNRGVLGYLPVDDRTAIKNFNKPYYRDTIKYYFGDNESQIADLYKVVCFLYDKVQDKLTDDEKEALSNILGKDVSLEKIKEINKLVGLVSTLVSKEF